MSLILAIVVIGLATYLTRVLPFLLGRHARHLSAWMGPEGPFAALGPSLIAALAALTWTPLGARALEGEAAAPLLTALAATVAMLAWRRDAGLAVVAGVVVYAVVALF
ncbi:AzlD domain-containing protein [Pararhodospirillum oryzae]|uniref:Uncharacterized protein n=1 Tax=Pararhodospirillum oryzae TaxID=478448 RepID=A0A512H3B4_9PROT|nr:AzlD domain-containing protein [Pararhodospirillum oryzae]GEO79959.1 hypothetical protein ROR02_00900 [Pararhodospirillum oryzae]